VQAGEFLRAHRFKRVAVIEGTAGLYFGNNQGVAVEGHNVDFAFGAAPVALDNKHAQGLKKTDGDVLTVPAQQVF
jgi:hypothetical protein